MHAGGHRFESVILHKTLDREKFFDILKKNTNDNLINYQKNTSNYLSKKVIKGVR